MTDMASTLVVLIDADDVKYVFSAWPDDICLAVCLTRDGNCSMVVFRRDERGAIPKRLMEILRVGVDDVCFVPRVHGFATKHFRYSDERRLMALVASDPDVLDEAVDYAVNYTYAIEEGLNPAVVLGWELPDEPAPRRSSAAPVGAARRQAEDPSTGTLRGMSPLLPDFLRKSAVQTRRPRFASVRKSKLGMMLPQA